MAVNMVIKHTLLVCLSTMALLGKIVFTDM